MTGRGIRVGFVIPADRILVGPHDEQGVPTGPQEAVTVVAVRLFDEADAPSFPALAVDYDGDGNATGCVLYASRQTPVMLLSDPAPLPEGMAA